MEIPRESYLKDPETENHIAELIRAAEAGNADAQCYLAWSYDEGEGVEVDHEKAFYWYTRSAEAGDATGQFNLAMCYELGTGTEIDCKKAFYWYEKSAELGYPKARKVLKTWESGK